MLLPRRTWAFALSASIASAFKDTSPLFLFSSSQDITPSRQRNLLRADSAWDQITPILKACQAATYIVVDQAAVSAQDFSGDDATPHMKQWATGKSMSSLIVSEVLGRIDYADVAGLLVSKCHARVEQVDATSGQISADTEGARVISVSFAAPPSEQSARVASLREHDDFLNALVARTSSQPQLIIYTTSPVPASVSQTHGTPQHEMHLYENEEPFDQELHLDLKRDFAPRQKPNNNTSLPLFETYSYFNTAIFTAILVSVVLFLLLYIGVSAVASVQVSYYSFSKEMGPAAQKKQQ